MPDGRPFPLRLVFYPALLLLAGTAFFLDQPAADLLAAGLPRDLRKTMDLVSDYGDWLPLMAACGVLLLAGWRIGAGWRRTIVAMILASTLAGAAVNVFRLTTGRTRPLNTEVQQGWYGPSRIGQSKFNSFPSGHTATAAGAALVLVFTTPALAILGIAITSLMIAARILTGAHHPSDTAIAIFFAIAVVDFVQHWLMPRLTRRFVFLQPG